MVGSLQHSNSESSETELIRTKRLSSSDNASVSGSEASFGKLTIVSDESGTTQRKMLLPPFDGPIPEVSGGIVMGAPRPCPGANALRQEAAHQYNTRIILEPGGARGEQVPMLGHSMVYSSMRSGSSVASSRGVGHGETVPYSETSVHLAPPPPPNDHHGMTRRQNGVIASPSSRREHRVKLPYSRASRHSRTCLLRRRTLLTLSLASAMLSAICILSLSFIIVNMSSIPNRNVLILDEHGHGYCVPCLKLQHGLDMSNDEKPLMNNLNKIGRKDNDTLCCARTSEQMSDLVTLLAKQQEKLIEVEKAKYNDPAGLMEEITQQRLLRFTPVSAHKSLKEFQKDQDQETKEEEEEKLNEPTRLVFSTTNSPKEHARNVSMGTNHMAIIYSGYYYVYTSVRFRFRRSHKITKCSQLKYKTWTHTVERYSSYVKETAPLLKGVTQCCETCTNHDTTAFSGGVFLLRRGDYVYVTASGQSIALDDKSGSYMGLVMLGSTANTGLTEKTAVAAIGQKHAQ